MATFTRPTPETAVLRLCPVCMAPPQIFRGEIEGNDVWVICCPDCGNQMIGKRMEGLGLVNRDIIASLKPGDDFDEMVTLWNNVDTGKGVNP